MQVKAEHVLLGGVLVGAAGLTLHSLLRPKPVPGVLGAQFKGFEVKKKSPGTTTRRATGETALLFMFYPLVSITPDVSGTFTVEWNWVNLLDGKDFGYSTPTIVNSFPGLTGGLAVTVQLVDNRDPATTGRDPYYEGSIGVGDKNLPMDGLWHSFKSTVTIRVKSPTGAFIDLTGVLGPEDFKCVGVLSASFAGFTLKKK